ncbi:unnamed protein product [Cylicocyclus nassatus]|uniref:Beta-N-acetylhexosaminidase n=1 Tax=Cylicocyclus nassatus TaxID=53992 RepID=A0AA36DPM4_CYLNA|nr:unnamed protein product [Cylicocyclus nassatus]
MFPYEGALGEIKNGNAYTHDEALDILRHAKSLKLSVIPLVQTIGHLEWILKTKNFAEFCENPDYPLVMKLHSEVGMPYVHIGADEAYIMGECPADLRILPNYANNKKRLVFDYLKKVAKNITLQYPQTKVIIWHDEFENVNDTLVKQYDLDRLVTPVVWYYQPDLATKLPKYKWKQLARSFSSVWGASAFKGHEVRDVIRDFMLIKQQHDNAMTSEEAEYLQPYQVQLNASSSYGIRKFENMYENYLQRLDEMISLLRFSMQELFYEDVFFEFMADYIESFYSDLESRLKNVRAINSRKVYPPRPWFQSKGALDYHSSVYMK